MITHQATELFVADHVADRQREAAAARLAAIARCCRPGTWAQTVRRAGAALASRCSRRDRRAAARCCAGA